MADIPEADTSAAQRGAPAGRDPKKDRDLPEVFRTVTERIQSGIKAVSKRRSEPPERTGKSPINSPCKKQIMAQNEENLLLRGTSGTIAKMITYRQRAGKTVISKKHGKSSVPAGYEVRVRRGHFDNIFFQPVIQILNGIKPERFVFETDVYAVFL